MSGLRASIELLRRELRNARVKMEVDFHSMIIGSSSAFVDLFRYLFCDFDRNVSLYLTSNNFLLAGTSDRRFMEILYRICRDLLKIKPPLSLAQFVTNSFAEKKLKMSAEIVKSVAELKSHLNKRASSAARLFQKTSGILSTTPTCAVRRQTALSSKSSNLVARMPAKQEATSSFTNDCTSSKLVLTPQNSNASQSEPDQSIQESKYVSDLMISLNTISNQISQIVDRVEGIESRVNAIEKPLRNGNIGKNLSTLPENVAKNNLEEDIKSKRNVAVAQSDSSPKYSNGSEQNPLLARSNTVQVTTPLVKRNHQPLNVLPLSDVNLSVETTDSISQPLLKIEDRHSPEVTKLCSGDGIKMPTSVVSHNSDKLHKLPDEGTSSYRSRLCYHGDVCYRENVNLDSQWTKPALMDYRSKVLGSDDNSDLYKSHSFSYLNNKNDCSVYCSNSNNARFDVDQSLEQQISRISHMLAETQILLNGRRPIPRS
nr:centrosomal protein of 44 kDa [Hymenolepis microstoma]